MKNIVLLLLVIFFLSACKSGFQTSNMYTGKSREKLQLVNKHNQNSESKITEKNETVQETSFEALEFRINGLADEVLDEVSDTDGGTFISENVELESPEESRDDLPSPQDASYIGIKEPGHQTGSIVDAQDEQQLGLEIEEEDLRETDTYAILSMLAGIGAIPTLGFLGIASIVFGIIALKRISRNPETLKGKGMANFGIIIGAIAIIAAMFFILFFVGV